MDMGDSDSDGGGFGVGILFDVGGGIGGFIVLIVFVGILIYCSMQHDERQNEDHHRFCAHVCKQYDDKPIIQGSQCYCEDEQGIYDPSTPRTPIAPIVEKSR